MPTVGRRSRSASSACLITIGPHLTLGGSSFGVLVAFGAASFSALAIVTLRSMSGSGGEHPLAITFYFSLTTVICSALTAVAGWPMPTAEQWLFIGLARCSACPGSY